MWAGRRRKSCTGVRGLKDRLETPLACGIVPRTKREHKVEAMIRMRLGADHA
jgi:hypothetical protein